MNSLTWVKIVVTVVLLLIFVLGTLDKNINQTFYNIAFQTFGSRKAKRIQQFFQKYWGIPLVLLLLLIWFVFR